MVSSLSLSDCGVPDSVSLEPLGFDPGSRVALNPSSWASLTLSPSSVLLRYSELRGPEAEALVDLSRSLDGGFLTFIGPLILDSLLHRLLPKVFSPNIISSLQNEQWRFSQVRRVGSHTEAILASVQTNCSEGAGVKGRRHRTGIRPFQDLALCFLS